MPDTDTDRPDRFVYYYEDEFPELHDRIRSYGRELRRIRHRRGMTQRQLEERVGLYRGEISALERGVYDPTWTLVCDLAAALGLPLHEFASRLDATGQALAG